jgi:hypothetical protein
MSRKEISLKYDYVALSWWHEQQHQQLLSCGPQPPYYDSTRRPPCSVVVYEYDAASRPLWPYTAIRRGYLLVLRAACCCVLDAGRFFLAARWSPKSDTDTVDCIIAGVRDCVSSV